MGVIQEFREFAVKGNALDMAVGLIIGLAFNKVVTSLVNDIIMPPIGLAIGGVEFKDLMIVLRGAHLGPDGTMIPPVAIGYGLFINAVIEFLIIAFSAFIIVKAMNRIIRRREETAAV
ncbi:MAG TPA: large-conductance mechanosensitive channel protein MscL [Rhodothermales bacterium]|nr:large-conductance mechanosensitive channel protein MscL [Rhodothermales bacterium]